MQKKHEKVLVSLAQLVWIMHNICKVCGSNPNHHKKKNEKVQHLGHFFALRLYYKVKKYEESQTTRL